MILKQWRGIYKRGKSTMPFVALAGLAGYGFLAWEQAGRGLGWKASVAGGVLTAAIVPFTLLFMKGTNGRLMEGANTGTKAMTSSEVKYLLTKWNTLNLVRSALPLAGTLVGLWGLLG